jgi:hypothetical protein
MEAQMLYILAVVLKVLIVVLMSLLLTALSEVFWHKYLFHSKPDVFKRYLTSRWGYELDEHTRHHTICKDRMEDNVCTHEEYKVQHLSNVYAAASVAYSVQAAILWLLGFSAVYYCFAGVSTFGLFTFWYMFEDHFHLAMHKRDYYQKRIANTWQDKWFRYARRLHIIHHRDPGVNYGFVFFPLGDLLLGTYRHSYKHYVRKANKYEKSPV